MFLVNASNSLETSIDFDDNVHVGHVDLMFDEEGAEDICLVGVTFKLPISTTNLVVTLPEWKEIDKMVREKLSSCYK